MDIFYIIGIVLAAVLFYFGGRFDGKHEAEAELRVLKRKYARVHGLWATDRANLIGGRLRSAFFRIGYPREKL